MLWRGLDHGGLVMTFSEGSGAMLCTCCDHLKGLVRSAGVKFASTNVVVSVT